MLQTCGHHCRKDYILFLRTNFGESYVAESGSLREIAEEDWPTLMVKSESQPWASLAVTAKNNNFRNPLPF